jgi:hypothetical protein
MNWREGISQRTKRWSGISISLANNGHVFDVHCVGVTSEGFRKKHRMPKHQNGAEGAHRGLQVQIGCGGNNPKSEIANPKSRPVLQSYGLAAGLA